MPLTVADLRHHAYNRSLWQETGPANKATERAIKRLGFVQADPIRAPARAQDLILRPRVAHYRAGDLERRYENLPIEEDYFVNYGFLARDLMPLFHPRRIATPRIEREAPGLMQHVLAHVQQHGATHPKTLETVFGKKRVGNYWGGASQATTRALEALHHRGDVRVVRREQGIKIYGPRVHKHVPLGPDEQAKQILDLILRVYAPLSTRSLGQLLGFARYGAPHLAKELRVAVKDANTRQESIDGVVYHFVPGERLRLAPPEGVRIVAPFDPVVWDRARFEHVHGWPYRFEAYTPSAKRQWGYYALPVLWQGRAVGWANIAWRNQEFLPEVGLLAPIKSRVFARALKEELERIATFLGAS